MKRRYMIQTQRNGVWVDLYVCATKLEAQRKVQRWDGPARIIVCMR